jgi:hypothetical protein
VIVGVQVVDDPKRYDHVKRVIRKWDVFDIRDPESGGSAVRSRMTDHRLRDVDPPHRVAALHELRRHLARAAASVKDRRGGRDRGLHHLQCKPLARD